MDSTLVSTLEALIVENARDPSHIKPSQVLQDLGTPTVSFAVLEDGAVTSHCITSAHDDTNTLFQACSISKAVAALAVFTMIEQGQLSLHASIADYLPPSDLHMLETDSTKGMAKHITISHLLSHTSGLETSGCLGFPGYDTITNSNPLPSIRDILRGDPPSNTLPIKLRDFPGYRFNYSGGGITVLQLIMEQVTSLPFAEIMQHYVLQPLSMNRSTYCVPCDKDINGCTKETHQSDGNYARAHYTGYTPCEAAHRVNPEQAAAGLWSTPIDLLKVASAIQQSYSGNGRSILSQIATKDMVTEVQEGMSHCWYVGPGFFRHPGGNMPGWRCSLFGSLDDETQRAIAIMTNSIEGVVAYTKILHAICYLRNWPPSPIVWASDPTIIPFADTNARLPSADVVEPWTGYWAASNRPQAKLQLQLVDGRPYISMYKSAAFPLYNAAHSRHGGTDEGNIVADLVCKGGLDILIRLIEAQGGEKLLQFWNGNTSDKSIMNKVAA